MRAIDGSDFLSRTYMACRLGGPNAGAYLHVMQEFLAAMRRSGCLDVTVEDAWFAANTAVVGLKFAARRPDPAADGRSIASEQHQALLNLVEASLRDLVALWNRGNLPALRNLGYALHNLPDHLRKQGRFSSSRFEFNFRVAASHWSAYSIELQQALGAVLGLEPEAANTLAASEGFGVHMAK